MINTPHCINALLDRHIAKKAGEGRGVIHVNDWPVASKFREGTERKSGRTDHVNEGSPRKNKN